MPVDIKKIYEEIKPKITFKTLYQILIGLGVLFICYTIYVGRSNGTIKDVLIENARIQKKIDSVQENNKFLTHRFYEMEERQITFNKAINKNNDLISQNNTEMAKLKKIYNEKINTASTYSISQLDSFFSARYENR